MENLRKIIGQRIKLLRVERALSQEQLAEEIGLSISSISKLERGINMPGVDTLLALARALNCSLDDFVVDEESLPKGSGLRARQSLEQEAWAVLTTLNDAKLKAVISAARAIADISE